MTQNNQKGQVKQSRWPLYISLGSLLSLALLYFAVPDVNDFFKEAFETLTSDNNQRISNWVDQLGFWGPIFIILTMVLQMFLLIIPSPLLMVVSVLAYGPYWGTLISVSAVAVASSIGYFVGRYLGEVAIARLLGGDKEKQLEFYVEKYGVWAVIITRLAPFLSNDAISFVGGILRMGYWRFIGATLVGIFPLAVLVGYFGENNDRLKAGLIWVSALSLILFVSYIIYNNKKNPYKSKSKKNRS
ncbi:TVP38/TMEM64 family protein [Sunxiuqinia dokdonensis]|uniref:TVP38/TMEM64 family membrane protein n=1 Tax=Sunxiuqinia dokdonensis TaxID=1409788 RepID=A0A0L8VAB1_9BACT|nr:TVP38/TMEM64 family protein [Sunxiuqinia dokdonensis]KOH45415.1 alkaline phosphatase like protein [Sunxiuqinia dokdonensis]